VPLLPVLTEPEVRTTPEQIQIIARALQVARHQVTPAVVHHIQVVAVLLIQVVAALAVLTAAPAVVAEDHVQAVEAVVEAVEEDKTVIDI